jgi:hypothetical protein
MESNSCNTPGYIPKSKFPTMFSQYGNGTGLADYLHSWLLHKCVGNLEGVAGPPKVYGPFLEDRGAKFLGDVVSLHILG